MRLSIILPVFNAEKTLEKTLRSILKQLSSEVEVVVVDDGSTDSTPMILSRFASEHGDRFHVIRQENAGAAAARNTAIEQATGDYLAFVDADDRLIEGAVETILKETENEVDILGWDWQTDFGGNVRRFRQADYQDAEFAIKNLMGGTMKWNLWLFAVKRKLLEEKEIRFLPGADMGEDMGLMLRTFACATHVRQIHEVLYEYNASNPTSISLQLNEKRRKEVSRNLSLAESFLMSSPYAEVCKVFLPHLKLYIKLPLLIGKAKENYHLWYEWFPEANAFACKNEALPFHTRFLQWMASRRMWNLVLLYNDIYKTVTRL